MDIQKLISIYNDLVHSKKSSTDAVTQTEDFRNGLTDYSLTDFVQVLNVGFNTDNFKTDMDFEEIKHQIIKFNYQT